MSALISAAVFSVNVATESTSKQAVALKLYDCIVVIGRFNAVGDTAAAVSCRADKDDAVSFYAVDTSDFGDGGNWRIAAGVYKADTEEAKASKNRIINGVMELPKDQAVLTEPYDTVTVQSFYHSQSEVNNTIAKAAKERGVCSFYIVHQVDANRDGNQRITILIYRADVKKRIVQNPDAIPADPDAGHAALAVGGETAEKVEIPGVATIAFPSAKVGRFFETRPVKGGCYTVTPPDGTKVEGLNRATAAMMVPFDSIKFTGDYGNVTEASYQIVKCVAKKGAEYYHITRQWSERGNNVTISADLYK